MQKEGIAARLESRRRETQGSFQRPKNLVSGGQGSRSRETHNVPTASHHRPLHCPPGNMQSVIMIFPRTRLRSFEPPRRNAHVQASRRRRCRTKEQEPWAEAFRRAFINYFEVLRVVRAAAQSMRLYSDCQTHLRNIRCEQSHNEANRE